MTEEIKEIIFQLEIVARKHTIKVLDTGNIETMPASIVDELRLNNYNAKILLNYITNLQKENGELKDIIKKDNHLLGCNFSKKDKYKQERDIYKQRNEKAIEYIENSGVEILCDNIYDKSDELLNILEGGNE